MTRPSRRYQKWAVAVALLAGVAACTDSDKIPPKGSQVAVSAIPATIPLAAGAECISLLNVPTCGTSKIVASVSSELGVPLSDQDVRFNNEAGRLFLGDVSNPIDAANIPISTDDDGNAVVNLITSGTTKITARSGLNSGTLTVSTVVGNLSAILLNLDTTSTGCTGTTQNVTSCGQKVCFKAEAVDASGDGVPGVVLVFSLQNNVSGDNTFSVQFSPSQDTTNSNGEVFTSFTPDTTCTAECGGNKDCQAEVVVKTQGASLTSTPFALTVDIP
jgi:hypothetical protein